jgi:hypothetical protein
LNDALSFDLRLIECNISFEEFLGE